jgi:hypothetical protein
MTLGLNLGLHQSSAGSFLGDGTAIAGILDLLQPERNGLAFDFLQDDPQLLIRDEANPLNDYLGSFNSKVPVAWNSPKLIGQVDDRELVTNQTGAGAAVGTPGTNPISWTTGITGITKGIAATGVDANGIPYVDFRFNGTMGASTGCNVDTLIGIAGLTGQRYRSSMYLALVAGSFANITNAALTVREGDSGGSLVNPSATNAHTTTDLRAQITSTMQLFSGDLETTGGINTRQITQRLAFFSLSGGAVDFTIRIGLPSLKRLDVVYEHAPHNYVRNSAVQGVVAGSPGTIPTNWAILGNTAHITRTILGTEVVDGITCLRIRFNGTNTSGGSIYPDVNFEGTNQIPAVAGTTWTASGYIALVGGSLTGLTGGIRLRVAEHNSGGTYLTEGANSNLPLTASLQRFTHTRTLTNGSAAFVAASFSTEIVNGVTYDFTLLVGLPQIERRAWAGTPIRTTGSARFPVIPERITSRNQIRNNVAAGAVAGTPGTLPTNWTVSGSDGSLSRTVVGTGIINGFEYIDIRYFGTAASSTSIGVALGDPAHAPALNGQTWTLSAYLAVVGGSTANLTSVSLLIGEWTSSNSFVVAGGSNPTGLTASLQRFVATRTLAGGATTARTGGLINIGFNNGAAVDITLRISMPQLEQQSFATDPIRTTGLARNGNTILGVPVEGGRTNVITNNTMQGAVAGAPGTIPTNWNILNGNGLTRTISRGVIDGQDFIDFRFNGTTIDNSGIQLDFSLFTAIAALTGQAWTVGANLALVGGSTANINIALNLREGTSGGALVLINSGPSTHHSLLPVLQRFTYTVTLSGGGTVANVTPRVNIGFGSGVAVDFTLRIALPQLEQAAFASLTPIRTVNAAVTRAADSPALGVANFPSMASGGHIMVEYIPGNVSVGAGILALRQDAGNATGLFQDTINLNLLNNISGSPAPGITAISPMVARRTYRATGSFRSNDHKTAANGGTIAKSASGATLPNYAELRFGWMTSGPNDFSFGYLRRGRVVPRVLSDAETVELSRLAA